jgi:glycosyltransferase involved in cell wall biosynthesis
VTSWGIPKEKITVVYNAFDSLPSLPDKETIRKQLGVSGPLLLSAGRLVPWKGFATLITLLPEIHKMHPHTKLFIAGSGPLLGELKKLVSESGLTEYVTLLGDVEHGKLMEYIRAADCFVLNTGYEGLSHQLLEVLAVGTPIVTTNIGGNPELIEDGVTGVLVPYNDRDALLRAIISTLAEPLRAEEMSARGEKFVSSFTVDRMVLHTEDVIKETTTRA